MSDDGYDWDMAQILHPDLSYPTSSRPASSPTPSDPRSVDPAETWDAPREERCHRAGDERDDWRYARTPEYNEEDDPIMDAYDRMDGNWASDKPSAATALHIGAKTGHGLIFRNEGVTADAAVAFIKHHIEVSNADHASTARTARATSTITTYPLALVPEVQFSSPAAHFVGLSPESIEEWASVSNPKVIIHIFNIKSGFFVDDTPAWTEYAKLKATIALTGTRYVSRDDDISVILPRPDDRTRAKGLHSRAFLFTMKKEATASALLALKLISYDTMTIAFYPFEVKMPSLAIRLAGFAPHTTEADVRRIVATSWRAEPTRSRLLPIVAHFAHANVRLVDDTYFEHWVDTVSATKYACAGGDIFSIIILPPAHCADYFAWYRRVIRNALYIDRSDRGCGIGHVSNFTYCVICGGNDHPAGLCPFTKIPGWVAPEPREAVGKLRVDRDLGGQHVGAYANTGQMISI
jgi:hypothetical protein